MNKNTFAKILAWLGAAITTLGANGIFGKFSGAATVAGPLLTAGAAHVASDTSAGHPNGNQKTN